MTVAELVLLGRNVERIAFRPYRTQKIRFLAQGHSEAANEHVNRAKLDLLVVTPHGIKQLLA
jgi:hypothetical protein